MKYKKDKHDMWYMVKLDMRQRYRHYIDKVYLTDSCKGLEEMSITFPRP